MSVLQRIHRLWVYALVVMLPVTSGCIGTQLKFKTVIPQMGEAPGGWQAACVEALFQNMTTHDSHVCLIGIGMPIHTRAIGHISAWDAADITTACIHEAADRVVQPAPPSVPSALACMNFKTELERTLLTRVMGSRVTLRCEAGIPRTPVGFDP